MNERMIEHTQTHANDDICTEKKKWTYKIVKSHQRKEKKILILLATSDSRICSNRFVGRMTAEWWFMKNLFIVAFLQYYFCIIHIISIHMNFVCDFVVCVKCICSILLAGQMAGWATLYFIYLEIEKKSTYLFFWQPIRMN